MKNWLVLLSLGFVFIACEEKEDDEIYSAQVCIDRSLPGTVDACLAKISSHTSQRAYVLRCAADFIRAGITTPTIVQAIVNIDDNSDNNTTDPSIAFYQEFTFTDSNAATTAVSNCTASGSKNLLILALSAQVATEMNSLAAGDLQTWVNGLNSGAITALDDTQMTTIGNSILQMQPIACAESGAFYETEVCDNFGAATGASSDPLAVAEAFLAQLQNGNN
jgi:hypothetical protein